MKKKFKEEVCNFIENHCVRKNSSLPGLEASKAYYLKENNVYLSNSISDIAYLLEKGIKHKIQSTFGGKEPVANLGFNEEDQKWYGWSHRAIFGFGIGSVCKKGNCAFKPSNKEDFIEREISFWGDSEYAVNGEVNYIEKKNGIIITYVYNDSVPNKSLRGTTYEHFSKYPNKWGKGEWTATTLEEAKEMAIDFANSI